MKSITKLLSVVVIVGALSGSGTASADNQIGIKAGIGSNGLSSAAGSRTGIVVGGFLEAGLGPNVYLQPELLFNGAYNGLSYIDVPINLKVKFDASPVVKPYLAAGPLIGLKISDTAATSKSINFGVDFGGGAEFAIAPAMTLGLDIRYNLGLSDISSVTVPGFTTKTKYLQFAAALGFAL